MELDISPVRPQMAQSQVESVAKNGLANEDVRVHSDSRANDMATQLVKANGNEADKDISKPETVVRALGTVQEFMNLHNRQLDFSLDEGSNKTVVRVTDKESGEVIRQIPSEEVLKLSERIRELKLDVGAAVGILFSNKA